MKKFAFLSLVSVLAFGLFAEEVKPVEYYTNAAAIAELCVRTKNLSFDIRKVNPADYALMDDIMSKGSNVVRSTGYWYDRGFPKTTVRYLESIKAEYPRWYEFERCFFGDNKKINWYEINRDDPELGADYICSFNINNWQEYTIVTYKNLVIQSATKRVKRQLRSEGKGIVAHDGVNPVQERLDAVSKALDAPKLAGLKEALANCGVKLSVDVAKYLPTDAEVEDIKDKVFNGDIEFTNRAKAVLITCLGVAEYNKFVEAYNK